MPAELFTPMASIPKLSAVVPNPNDVEAWFMAFVYLFADIELRPEATVR